LGLNVYKSFVYDVICLIQSLEDSYFNEYEKYMDEKQKNIVQDIKKQLVKQGFNDFNEYLSMSDICYIISILVPNSQNNNITIDFLIAMFEKPEIILQTLKSKVDVNSFIGSRLCSVSEKLITGYAQRYVSAFKALKAINFNKIWTEQLTQHIDLSVQQYYQSLHQYNISEILSDISVLKAESIDDFDVIITYFSYPIGFALNSGMLLFIGSFEPNKLLSIVIHELMHCFSSKELEQRYCQIKEQDVFLKETNRTLIEKFHSTYEEEFVVAIELFMSLRHNLYIRDELLQMAKERYDSCMPLSVIFFEYLCTEMSQLKSYNDWLLERLDSKYFYDTTIREKADRIIPGFSSNYYQKNS